MNLFFDENITQDTTTYQLSESESKHVVKVLRMHEGDQIGLLNGKGLQATATIIDANQKRCVVDIVERHQETAPNYAVHIAIAPTKMNERMEWFIEKATEIGITDITFLLTKNSERKAIKLDRFQAIAISAMKQSKRLFLPRITDLTKVDTFIKEHPNGFIAHCYEEEKETLLNIFDGQAPILIGPEGDFTLEESTLAKTHGYKVISLGNNRLRTETAGLYACMQAIMKL